MRKACNKCENIKPLRDFHRNRASSDGRTRICKPCARAAARVRGKRLSARSDDEIQYPTSKECCRCEQIKPAADFRLSRNLLDGLSPRCRDCDRDRDLARRDERLEAYHAKPWLAPSVEEKSCSKCGQLKSADDFTLSKKNSDGLQSQCRSCVKARLDQRRTRLGQRTQIEIPESKQCTTCHETKPADEFYRNKYLNDGLTYACKQCTKDYRAANRQPTDSLYNSLHYQANKAARNAYTFAYKKANPERVAEYARRRRARKKGALVSASVDGVLNVMESYKRVCVYCNGGADTIDHIVPLSSGGAHSVDNLVAACLSCNSRKSDRPLIKFMLIKAEEDRCLTYA